MLATMTTSAPGTLRDALEREQGDQRGEAAAETRRLPVADTRTICASSCANDPACICNADQMRPLLDAR